MQAMAITDSTRQVRMLSRVVSASGGVAFLWGDQRAQGGVDGLLIGKMFGDVWGEEDEMCSCAVAVGVLAADTAL